MIFSTAYFPFVGGAEVAVKEITDRIPDFEFVMITAKLARSLPKYERLGNVEVYRIGLGIPIIDKLFLAFFGANFASRLAKKNKFDATWAIMASFGGLAALGFKKQHKDIPFLLTLQEGDDLKEIERKAFWLGEKFKKIFTQADYIQAISSYLALWAKRMGALVPIKVVPNGVDLERFKLEIRPEIEALKKELGIKKPEKIILSVSRLVKKNGLEDLIQAIAKISDGGQSVKLLICGQGEEESVLKKLVADLKIENKVLFLGHVAPDDLPKYYNLADVFCRPSLSEGLGNVFLEAMACQAPVVATPVGGIPDFLEEGKTGWFAQVKNPNSIADKIEYVLKAENKKEVEKVIAAAKKMVEVKFNWKDIAKNIEKILTDLTS